jgi:hypothetical protein
MTDIRSKAGHVLSTSDDPDARSLAAYVLGDASNERVTETVTPTRTATELRQLLRNIEGKEGQHERRLAIQAQLDALA